MGSHLVHEHLDSYDQSKSPVMEFKELSGSPFSYDAYQGIDYLQFPHSPFNVPAVPLPVTVPSPHLTFESLNLTGGLSDYSAYSSGASFTTGSPARPITPADNICTPALTHMSAGEMSDGMFPVEAASRRRNSAGSMSGGIPASPGQSSRAQYRFNPIATRSSVRERKRRAVKESYGSDDEEEDFAPQALSANTEVRREEIRRQRIESEQRRRDELRDGYRRLKDVLPISNQKSSKVSLLDRATTHIKYLEMTQQQLQTRLNQAEMETQRLRSLNEALMLSTAERHAPIGQAQGLAY